MKVKQKAIRGNAQVSGTLEIFFFANNENFPLWTYTHFFLLPSEFPPASTQFCRILHVSSSAAWL